MAKETNFETVPLTELSAKGLTPDDGQPKSIVLVVDDEVIIADTLSTILTRSGIAAMTAYDGQTALDIARVIPPDLLLTDVVMPDMNGIDLAIAVTEAAPNCRVLLFSGQAATQDLLAAARNTGRDFAIIAKPIHPRQLLARITESLKAPTTDFREHGCDADLPMRASQ
ncbi:MAG: response regulator [Terriglobia bacterium]|nr:response regulator [Terriglobia bacterium]